MEPEPEAFASAAAADVGVREEGSSSSGDEVLPAATATDEECAAKEEGAAPGELAAPAWPSKWHQLQLGAWCGVADGVPKGMREWWRGTEPFNTSLAAAGGVELLHVLPRAAVAKGGVCRAATAALACCRGTVMPPPIHLPPSHAPPCSLKMAPHRPQPPAPPAPPAPPRHPRLCVCAVTSFLSLGVARPVVGDGGP